MRPLGQAVCVDIDASRSIRTRSTVGKRTTRRRDQARSLFGSPCRPVYRRSRQPNADVVVRDVEECLRAADPRAFGERGGGADGRGWGLLVADGDLGLVGADVVGAA